MKKNRFFGFFGQSDPEKIFSDAQNTIEVTGELEGTQFVHELGSEQIATDEGSKLSELAAERQKSRIADELAKQVYHQFREVGNKFYFKDDPQKIAFEVRGRKLISSSQDERVAKAMVAVCQSKGWTRLKISGDREFCRQVWLEASLCNLKSVGYQPTKQDLAELEALSAKKSKNSIEQDVVEKGQNPVHVTRTQPEKPSATQSTSYAGQVLDFGAAPYQHNKKNQENYFIKLATDQGEKVVWGVDLERAIKKSATQIGDKVTLEFEGNKPVTVEKSKFDTQGRFIGTETFATHRNEWAIQKIDRQTVTEQGLTASVNQSTLPEDERSLRDTNTLQGTLVDYGRANYRHDKKHDKSFFVKLSTKQGEKNIWGVDLERAIHESGVRRGDNVLLGFKGRKQVTVEQSKYDQKGSFIGRETVSAHRNEWDVRKSDQHKVTEAVATTLVDATVKNAERREILKKALKERLSMLAESKRLPAIHVYDKSSPVKDLPERCVKQVPLVEREAKRTR
ncbi:MAG: LPD7 domain-containing protein (plasmid) [Candidatus Symbiodolus clandestinus]